MASSLPKILSPLPFPFPLQQRDKDEVMGFALKSEVESRIPESPPGVCPSHSLSDSLSLVLYLSLSTCLSLNQCQFLILLVRNHANQHEIMLEIPHFLSYTDE